jgi:dephospho-CoA kinase
MLLVGLTGGIGSGKSTVAHLLSERGAAVIDADQLARAAVARGTPGLKRVVETFGTEMLTPEGELDRRRLADVVFDDDVRRRELEAIVHPEVARRFAEEVERYRGSDRVVVYAVPLLVERGLAPAFDAVIVVAADEERRVARVMAARGLTEPEARKRMAAQATDEQRTEVADVVLDNDGTPEELQRQVDVLWADLSRRAAAGS